METHPDRTTSGNLEDYLLVAEAYEILGDPKQKREYDSFIKNDKRAIDMNLYKHYNTPQTSKTMSTEKQSEKMRELRQRLSEEA